jgi:hypothetical protein
MGSQTTVAEDLTLQAMAPLDVHWRLIHNGVVVSESDGGQLISKVTRAGVYRCEAWLNVAGEPTIWILSNPIYVTEAAPR